MSWQVVVLNMTGGSPRPNEDVAEDRCLVLGTASDIRERVTGSFPGTQWSRPLEGHFVASDESFSIHFDMHGEEPFRSMMMSIRGGREALPAITRFAKRNGWSLYDCSGTWLDLDQPSDEGWRGYNQLRQAYLARKLKENGECESRPRASDEMMRQVDLETRGLGVILYSPPAVAHIPEGSDYLREHFWEPDDVARHVMDCQLTAFCTGSPGSYRLRFFDGPPDESAVQDAAFKLRLGLQVVGGAICVRDLYDLMQWRAECPPEQQLATPDGWYRLTVVSSPPSSGIVGDGQVIDVSLEEVRKKPALRWEGVPTLC